MQAVSLLMELDSNSDYASSKLYKLSIMPAISLSLSLSAKQ